MEIAEYIRQAPSRNRSKPKFMAWLEANLRVQADICAFIESIPAAFSPDHAVGVQLDIVGSYAGVSRFLPFTPSESSRTMDDETYRKLIRSKIAQNAWDGSNETLPSLWSGLFPELGIEIADNRDMTMTAYIKGRFTVLQTEMINHGLLIPRPAGVECLYIIPSVIDGASAFIQSGLYSIQTHTIHEEE